MITKYNIFSDTLNLLFFPKLDLFLQKGFFTL